MSAIEHWLSGTDARESTEKPLREAVHRRAVFIVRPTNQTSAVQGLLLVGPGADL